MYFPFIYWSLLALSLVALLWLFLSRSKAALTVVLVFALEGVAWVTFWGWFLRDGLGPKAVPSTGFEAWKRFVSLTTAPIAILFAIMIAALVIYRRNREED